MYPRQPAEVAKAVFSHGQRGFALRRDEKQAAAGYLGCCPAAGGDDISVCQDVKHTHVGCRREIMSNLFEQRQ